MTQITISDNASARAYIEAEEPGVSIVGDIVALACARCGGSGHYAFNYMDGTRCYGCSGSGRGPRVPVVQYARRIKSRKAARARKARKVEAENQARADRADAWRAAHPDVHAALVPGVHRILDSLAAKLNRWGSLSDAQCALALRIAREAATRAEERNVSAPTGRTTFTGRIVSCKEYEGRYGVSEKITVKVETDGGVWLAWGTAPAELFRALHEEERRRRDANVSWEESGILQLVGSVVTLTATLQAGREPHFAIARRPTLVQVDKWGNAERRPSAED